MPSRPLVWRLNQRDSFRGMPYRRYSENDNFLDNCAHALFRPFLKMAEVDLTLQPPEAYNYR